MFTIESEYVASGMDKREYEQIEEIRPCGVCGRPKCNESDPVGCQ